MVQWLGMTWLWLTWMVPVCTPQRPRRVPRPPPATLKEPFSFSFFCVHPVSCASPESPDLKGFPRNEPNSQNLKASSSSPGVARCMTSKEDTSCWLAGMLYSRYCSLNFKLQFVLPGSAPRKLITFGCFCSYFHRALMHQSYSQRFNGIIIRNRSNKINKCEGCNSWYPRFWIGSALSHVCENAGRRESDSC